MRVLPDTNIVYASMFEAHPFHHRCRERVGRVQRGQDEGFFSAHSLAEMFSTSTAKKNPERVEPEETVQYLEKEILPYFTIVEFTRDDYIAVLNQLRKAGLSGALIFDALIVHAGKKAQVDYVLTLNIKHFHLVVPEFAAQIIEP